MFDLDLYFSVENWLRKLAFIIFEQLFLGGARVPSGYLFTGQGRKL
jgi:hypothetical protein